MIAKLETYRHDDWLMVGSGSHGAAAVATSSKTTLNLSGKQAIAVTGIVDALEESEFLRVGRVVALCDLAGDVSVANDSAVLQCLRGRVVGCVGIGEGTSFQVVDLDVNGERLVGLDVVAVRGVLEERRDHVAGAGDFTHDWGLLV